MVVQGPTLLSCSDVLRKYVLEELHPSMLAQLRQTSKAVLAYVDGSEVAWRRAAAVLISEELLLEGATGKGIQKLLRQQGSLSAILTSANPSPHKMTFLGIKDKLSFEDKPLWCMDLKWAGSASSHHQSHLVLAPAYGEALLLDTSDAAVLCLSLGPGWTSAWSSWCSDGIHAAVMYVKKDDTTPPESRSQFQLHVLDSSQLNDSSKSTDAVLPLHSSSSHGFGQQRGWAAGSISPAADSIVMPHWYNAAFFFSLPDLVRGAELVCPTVEGSKAEVHQADWLKDGRVVVQWTSTEPKRSLVITVHKPYEGGLLYSMSMPIEGQDCWASGIMSPAQPYLAIEVQKHAGWTSGKHVYVADLDTASISLLNIPMLRAEGPSRTCWSSSGKYLLLAKAQDEHQEEGRSWIIYASMGQIVFQEESYTWYKMCWGSYGNLDICLLKPPGSYRKSFKSPTRLLVLDGNKPAQFVHIKENFIFSFDKPQPDNTSFIPCRLAFVNWYDLIPEMGGLRHWKIDLGASLCSVEARQADLGIPSSAAVPTTIAWQPSLKSQCIYAAANKDCEIFLVDAAHDKLLSCVSFQELFDQTPQRDRDARSGWQEWHWPISLQWSKDGSKLAVCDGGQELGILSFQSPS